MNEFRSRVVRVWLGDSSLHRKLLFGRDGTAVRSFNKFASQSGWFGENRISLRDGSEQPTSECAIAILGDLSADANLLSTRTCP